MLGARAGRRPLLEELQRKHSSILYFCNLCVLLYLPSVVPGWRSHHGSLFRTAAPGQLRHPKGQSLGTGGEGEKGRRNGLINMVSFVGMLGVPNTDC